MQFQIDIRTKIVLLFFTNYLLLLRVLSIYEWIVVCFILLLFVIAKRYRYAVIYSVIFLILYWIDYFLLDILSGKTISFLSMISVGGRLMLPCFMVGSYILSTTSVHAFIQGLRKLRISEKILLSLAVMLRFLPTIKQDYRTIYRALQVRGVVVKKSDVFVRPIRFFEYVTIPLLMSATRTAQDLTVAVLTKSIGNNQKTSYQEYKLTIYDWFVYGVVTCLVICIQGGLIR